MARHVGGHPTAPCVEAQRPRVVVEAPQAGAGVTLLAQVAEQLAVRLTGQSGAPGRHGGAEVQQLCAAGRRESGHCAVRHDGEAVGTGVRELVGPAFADQVDAERVAVLREDVREPGHGALTLHLDDGVEQLGGERAEHHVPTLAAGPVGRPRVGRSATADPRR